MSSEWAVSTVGALCSRVFSGGTPTSTKSEYYGGGIPWLRTKEVNYEKIYATEETISEAGLAASAAKIVPINSVVVAMYGNGDTAGRVAITKVPLTTNQACCNLVVDSSKADYRFVYYYLKSNYKALVDLKNGGAQQNLNSQLIKSFPIYVPEPRVQVEIADVLESLDDRITLLRETNATLESIAQVLFKSWFVDFDPVRAKQEGRVPEGMDEATAALFPDGFEESELGLVPRGWAATNLGKVVSLHGGSIQTGPFGSQLHASDYSEHGIPVVMPKDISNRRIDTRSIARVSNEHVERLSRHQLKVGDIVFSRRGDVERHALVTRHEAGWLCGTGCLLVRPGSSWRWSAYLSMLLDAPQARAWLVQHAVGATMPNLNTGILGSVPMVLPPVSVLNQFEQVVMALEDSRSENFVTLSTLADLRDTLLPRLISGQLRLPETRAQLEGVLP